MIEAAQSVFVHSPMPANPALADAKVKAAGKDAESPGQEQQPDGDTFSFTLFGDDGFDFFDILDIVNPLQHIPILSALYRRLTGDEIAAAPRVLGGAVFGGPIGAIASLVNVFIQSITGKDMGEHVLAMFTGAPADKQIAAAAEPPQSAFAAGAAAASGASPLSVVPVTRAPLPPLPGSAVPLHAAIAPSPPPPRRAAPDLGALGQVAAPRPLADDTVAPFQAAVAPPPAAALVAAPRPLGASSPAATAAAVLRDGERKADAFAAANYRAMLESERAKQAHRQGQSVSGAAAPGGGWFSEVMLAALDKYGASARLARKTPPPQVNLLN